MFRLGVRLSAVHCVALTTLGRSGEHHSVMDLSDETNAPCFLPGDGQWDGWRMMPAIPTVRASLLINGKTTRREF
jgi:hypothetical protein